MEKHRPQLDIVVNAQKEVMKTLQGVAKIARDQHTLIKRLQKQDDTVSYAPITPRQTVVYITEPQKPQNDLIEIFLTPSGDLYREPKEKYLYSLKQEGMRLNLLSTLLESNEYIKTGNLMTKIGYSTTPAVRKAVGSINVNAKHNLKIKNNLIKNKMYSGYRINPMYVIKRTKF